MSEPFRVAMRPTRFCVICPACGEETQVDEWAGGGPDGIWMPTADEISCESCAAPIDVVSITIAPRGEVSPNQRQPVDVVERIR
jgi:phage terminase large subunit GpA-like protein